MSQTGTRSLNFEDIKFLRGIAEIEKNPNEHPDTSITDVPANTSSLRHVTDLSKRKIQYRIQPEERGFEKLGYVRLHPPAMRDNGQVGPRSVELTEKGRKAIMDWEKRHGEVDYENLSKATREELEMGISELRGKVKELESRVELSDSSTGSTQTSSVEGEEEVDIETELQQIHSQLDALKQAVNEIQDSPWGAVSEKKVNKMLRTQELAVAAGQLFMELGVERPQEAHQSDYDFSGAVENIQETLDTSTNGRGTEPVHEQNSEGEKSQSKAEPETTPNAEDRTQSGGETSSQRTYDGLDPDSEFDDPLPD